MLSIEINGGEIYSPIRKKFVKNTPEEKIRQKYVQRLVGYGYSVEQMDEEVSLTNSSRGLWRARADIVIWRNEKEKVAFLPALIVIECKAFGKSLTKQDFYQGLNYARWAWATFFVVTNGGQQAVFKKWERINELCQISNIPKANQAFDKAAINTILNESPKWKTQQGKDCGFKRVVNTGNAYGTIPLQWKPPWSMESNKERRQRIEKSYMEAFSTQGGDVLQISDLLMSVRENARGETGRNESGHVGYTVKNNAGDATRTWMQLVNYCGARGTMHIPMMKVRELFYDYFNETTFNNRDFKIGLLRDIETLSLLEKHTENRDGSILSTPLLRFVSNPGDFSVSIEMFPGMDINLIQDRIYRFLPDWFVEVQINNPAFYDFSLKMHIELFLLWRTEFSKKEIVTWLMLKEKSKDWKRFAGNNIEIFLSRVGGGVTYRYEKNSETFIFVKE